MIARRVCVSAHAASRLLERDPTVRTGNIVGHIFHDVQEAFRLGRTSKRIPRWAVSDGCSRVRKTGGRVERFVWNEACSACYVLVWARSDGDGRRSWIVVTTLGAQTAAAA